MSNESFKIKNAITLTPVDLASLTNPQAGDLACDINDSNKIKRYDANTLGWTEVGSGGVGNINALLTQTFDTAALAQFTQTGLALSTSNPIDGIQSARLIHQPATSQSFKQVIAVDRKYRGDLMNLSLQVRSSATSGNLTLLVTDETNSATIMASSSISTSQYQVATAVTNGTTTVNGFSNVDINTLKVGMTITGAGIPTATVISSINTAANTIVISQAATASATITAKFSALPDRRTFSFVIPTNCASLSYTVTALQEAGLPESYVDDVVIELANVSLLETSVTVPNLTAWQGYTPAFTNMGTPTSVEFEWRQNGENVDIRGKFTMVSGSAAEARIGLPAGLTSAGVGLIPSLQMVGSLGFNTTSALSINILVEPSVSYMTLGFQSASLAGLTKVNGSIIGAAAHSFFASVPCAGLSASSSVAIPLTQSGLVQEADSYFRGSSSTASFGSVLFNSLNVFRVQSINVSRGSDILFQDSATTGSTFTIQTSGIYSISASAQNTADTDELLYIFVNGVAVAFQRYGSSLGDTLGNAAATVYLNAGDIIRFEAEGTNTFIATASISKQGSLKQVSVNTNSKITIPTSELRFEGASSRGSTDTAIVKFDTQAKIRGDAFSVVNTAANGTVITMLKAGKLDISSSIYSGAVSGQYLYITKNQAVLTGAAPSASEILSSSGTSVTTGKALTASCSVFINVGDILRVTFGSAITADPINNLNLSFQEQEIQVSVSNTLPQFSESDSCVRLSGANGFGSTNTNVRRFASTVQNIGTDIEYIDSATLGGQFIAKAAGIYNVSYTEYSTANTTEMSLEIRVNGVPVAIDNQIQNTASLNSKWASGAVSPYLNIGDIVTAAVGVAANSNGTQAFFTMSKVGKPNVTGVNVTPFVNVPQPLSTIVFESQSGGAVSVPTGGALTPMLLGTSVIDTDGGKFSTTQWKVPRAGTYLISAAVASNAASGTKNSYIAVNGSTVAILAGAGVGSYSGMYGSHALTLAVGDLVSIGGVNQSGTTENWTLPYICITSTLQKSDTILTAPETFSTDTAALTYASSAAYTLSTLANAPVGTYITFVFTGSTTASKTQTTTRPTQTDADMNTSGILITPRAYAGTGTAAAPPYFAIQIGKGLKGRSLSGFTGAGKTGTTLSADASLSTLALFYGFAIQNYNELTGVLVLDAGTLYSSTHTSHGFFDSDGNLQAAGYWVVNASRNPALTGFGLNRIAARGVQSSAQSIANTGALVTVTYDAAKTYDTNGALNAATGVFTAPETGYYKVDACIMYNSSAWTTTYAEAVLVKNGASYSSMGYVPIMAAGTFFVQLKGSDTVYLAKNDTLSFGAAHTRAGGATPLFTNPAYNYFSITKVSI